MEKKTYYVIDEDDNVVWHTLTLREAQHLCNVMTEEDPEEYWEYYDADETPHPQLNAR